jgi:hypothetical protein
VRALPLLGGMEGEAPRPSLPGGDRDEILRDLEFSDEEINRIAAGGGVPPGRGTRD